MSRTLAPQTSPTAPSPAPTGARADSRGRQIRVALLAAALLFPTALTVPLPLDASAAIEVTDGNFSNPVIEIVDLQPFAAPDNELTGQPLGPLETSYQFTVAGVTFLFESLSGQPLRPSGVDGLLSFGFGGSAIAVTVSPPVFDLGFFGRPLDGCPGGTFVGTTGTEQAFWPTPCPGEVFFGAWNIGEIGAVDLSRPASVWVATEMRFFPPGVAPSEFADLALTKSVDVPAALNGVPIQYRIDVENLGPDDAPDVLITDFLPSGVFTGSPDPVTYDADNEVATLFEPLLQSSGLLSLILLGETPASRQDFSCGYNLLNVATVSSRAGDATLTNNLAIATTHFDDGALAGLSEICDDGIDNNCDGRVDCADVAQCRCRPTLPPLAGADPNCSGGFLEGLVELGLFAPTFCVPASNDAPDHACTVPRGECGGVRVPAFCCDPASWSNPGRTLDLSACDVGVPGCAPRDPNFKEADPGVNLHGYGYTAAGETISYTLHYENVGNADAHDVQILDVLDPDLDESTLVIADGGAYDPTTRTLVWTDPLLPPATPRSVSFEIAVRGDATPGTRVRNVGTILFPDAVPPSRIDTNFVEHVVPDPDLDLTPDLRVDGCTEVAPGTWKVHVVNDGAGFAYRVAATLEEAPAGVTVHQPRAEQFSHPDDLPDLPSVIAFATTTSSDTVSFETAGLGDPCASSLWTLEWEDIAGRRFSEEVGTSNRAPEAHCQDRTVATDGTGCSAQVSVDAGSFDPDGDPITTSQQPPGPYGPGDTLVELVVEDESGASDTCSATVRVEDRAAPVLYCNAPETIIPPDAPISFVATATDNCGEAEVTIVEYDCFKFTKKGRRVDKRQSCVVSFTDDTLTITDSGGVGDRITWLATAEDTSGNTLSRECAVDVVRPGGSR